MALCHPFFISSLFFLTTNVNAQSTFLETGAEQEIYTTILDFNFSSANHQLDQLTINNPSKYYLQNFSKALELVLSENKQIYKTTQHLLESNIDKIEDSNISSASTDFYLAETYLYLSFIEVIFNDRLSAYWDFRKAYKLVEKNIDNHPEFYPNYKTLALINTIIGSIPQEHKWLPNLLGFEGNIDLAAQHYKSASLHSPLLTTECYLYNALSQSIILKNTLDTKNNFPNEENVIKSNGYLFVTGLFTPIPINQKKL